MLKISYIEREKSTMSKLTDNCEFQYDQYDNILTGTFQKRISSKKYPPRVAAIKQIIGYEIFRQWESCGKCQTTYTDERWIVQIETTYHRFYTRVFKTLRDAQNYASSKI